MYGIHPDVSAADRERERRAMIRSKVCTVARTRENARARVRACARVLSHCCGKNGRDRANERRGRRSGRRRNAAARADDDDVEKLDEERARWWGGGGGNQLRAHSRMRWGVGLFVADLIRRRVWRERKKGEFEWWGASERVEGADKNGGAKRKEEGRERERERERESRAAGP